MDRKMGVLASLRSGPKSLRGQDLGVDRKVWKEGVGIIWASSRRGPESVCVCVCGGGGGGGG